MRDPRDEAIEEIGSVISEGGGRGYASLEVLLDAIDTLMAERDEACAEIERLRRDRDELRGALTMIVRHVKLGPGVGESWSEAIRRAERSLASTQTEPSAPTTQEDR